MFWKERSEYLEFVFNPFANVMMFKQYQYIICFKNVFLR